MSKPHAGEPIPEYRHSDVRRERTDVDTKAIVGFGVALSVGLAIVMFALWGMFEHFLTQETELKRSGYPLATERNATATPSERLPPQPRLEGIVPTQAGPSMSRDDPIQARQLVAEQEAMLASYGWIDDQHTIARIPIAEAIKRLAGKLPARIRRIGQAERPPSPTNSGREPRRSDQ